MCERHASQVEGRGQGERSPLISMTRSQKWRHRHRRSPGRANAINIKVAQGGFSVSVLFQMQVQFILNKNLNAPRPSEHPPVRGKKCQNV